MFICIEKNPNGSHASQVGGIIQDGWAYWDESAVPVPETFPYVDIEVEEVYHAPIVKDRSILLEGETMSQEQVILIPEFTRLEVINAKEREIPVEEPNYEPTQLDRIEAQIAYIAMMTDVELEV